VNDEKMQDFQENPRPQPGEQPSEQQTSRPRAHAQQAADNALAATDLAIGIGAAGIDFARSVALRGRPLLDSVMSSLTSAAQTAAPLADRTWQAGPQPWLRQTAARGRQDREALTAAVIRFILTRVPGVADAVLDQLDLTALVAERVDINALAAQVDAIAFLDRIDSDALTRYLVEELDLPAIIQSSTGSIMSDAVHDVRMQSISADERLSRAVDAMLLRRRARRTAAPEAAHEAARPASP
jgi:hypothetical protein